MTSGPRRGSQPEGEERYYQQLLGAVTEVRATIGSLREQLTRDVETQISQRDIRRDERLAEILGLIARAEGKITVIENMVFGDARSGLIGLAPQLKVMDDKLDELVLERQKLRWWVRGAAVGLGLTSAQITGLLPAILKFLTGP